MADGANRGIRRRHPLLESRHRGLDAPLRRAIPRGQGIRKAQVSGSLMFAFSLPAYTNQRASCRDQSGPAYNHHHGQRPSTVRLTGKTPTCASTPSTSLSATWIAAWILPESARIPSGARYPASIRLSPGRGRPSRRNHGAPADRARPRFGRIQAHRPSRPDRVSDRRCRCQIPRMEQARSSLSLYAAPEAGQA